MSFLSPLLLILFVPLAGAIIVLYLLKLKRNERTVSSIFLWQDAVADLQANAPFQKLKKSLLLFLQLAALLLIVLAVARPFMRARGLVDNKIVVILDSSASMQMTDVSPSRFGDAKNRALKIVDAMGPGDTMLVITAGAKTKVVSSFTSDKKALMGAISGLEPADTGCNMRQAMVLAFSLVQGKSAVPPRIVVFSDGNFGNITDLSPNTAELNFVKVGSECDNVAITGLDARKTLAGDQQVFIGLHNYSKRERAFNLEIELNGQLVGIEEETLKPGEVKQEIMPNIADVGGRVTAKLDIDDDLAADNTGSVYLAKRRKISVLLVTPGNVFLQNALNLDPRTQLTTAASLPAKWLKTRYDLVVFDRVAPPKSLPQGGYLLICAESPQGPAKLADKAQRPQVIDSAKNHPATAYVDFSNVRIAEASYLHVEPWAQTVVEGEGGTLMAAGAEGGRKFVQMGFNLLDTDFPLHVGFPIFAANCLDYLVPERDAASGEATRSGMPMYIYPTPDVKELTVTTPDGSSQTIKVTQSPVVFDGADRIGVYKFTGGKSFSKEFTCNLASAAESGAMPKDVVKVGAKSVASTGKLVRTNREFYPYLILLVLAILTFEWYAYHRRL